MCQGKAVKKNQNISYSVGFCSRKSCSLRDNVEKYSTANQATDDNMAHAYYMLDTEGYKHILRICNTSCFSTATMVAQTRLIATLYVH
jgi:hypothetical protein